MSSFFTDDGIQRVKTVESSAIAIEKKDFDKY